MSFCVRMKRGGEGENLYEERRERVDIIGRRRIFVLTGCPGTGDEFLISIP